MITVIYEQGQAKNSESGFLLIKLEVFGPFMFVQQLTDLFGLFFFSPFPFEILEIKIQTCCKDF